MRKFSRLIEPPLFRFEFPTCPLSPTPLPEAAAADVEETVDHRGEALPEVEDRGPACRGEGAPHCPILIQVEKGLGVHPCVLAEMHGVGVFAETSGAFPA